MRLYRFINQEFGMKALQERRLKISRIDELNDPFEFLGWKLRDTDMRDRLRRWKADRNDELGIVCFSRKWSNPLLWGHYADKHRGMALGFDVPDSGLYSPVKYRRTRLPVPSGRELTGDDVEDLLLTKFSAWRYELEYRSFCVLSQSIRDGDHYYEPFSDKLTLVEVIIGSWAEITRAELSDALGDQSARVESFKARPAFGSFKVVKNATTLFGSSVIIAASRRLLTASPRRAAHQRMLSVASD